MLLRLSVLFLSFVALAPAAVREVQVKERADAGSGRVYGDAGPYERISGTVTFAADPSLANNKIVNDIALAPRNAQGLVEYSADFVVMKPRDASKANGTILFEVPNRGGRAMTRFFDLGSAENQLGDGYLLEQGYTLVWLGWQADVPEGAEFMRLVAPVAKGIQGKVRADFVLDKAATTASLGDSGHKAYAPVDANEKGAVLTVRDRVEDARRTVPRNQWHFDGGNVAGNFEAGKIYEVVYTSQDPVIVGLGPAAVRDFISFLKYGGVPTTLSDEHEHIQRAMGFGISQSGRFLRDFVYEGFNADEQGRKVFDGVWAHVAGAGRGNFNFRFAQPSRDARPFLNFFYPVDVFPFSDAAILEKAEAAHVAPRLFLTNGSYEYWGRAAALIHTSPDGAGDLAPGPNTRIYYIAGAQHGAGKWPSEKSNTLYDADPLEYRFATRALLRDFGAWLKDGVEPPPSKYPLLSKAELTTPAQLKFPVPNVAQPKYPHKAYHVEYGDEPPKVGEPFATLVPQVDADGNDSGGVQLPEVRVPLGTFTGWNFRAKEMGAPDEMASFIGSYFPFAKTKAEREASHDPRPSIEERYASEDAYLSRVQAAAEQLVEQRFLLARDVGAVIERAKLEWGKAPDAPKWDVNNPPGPRTETKIDTKTGTWMNLDVSPAGDEIVFEMLGDIYTIPIAGGEAKALTTGMAWDMQPRFSPDGQRIAFTSDRGGGDNIWTMKRDGTDLKQVSKEDFRLLNSPSWSPDGQYVIAHKHFSSQRSIGSGEVWMYHVTGGGGVQLTKKPNDQQDVGEGAFSPDGRYVYFSQDTTPGPFFQYNKDPNAGIYSIKRLDRKTGDIDVLISGPGGAARPTPSHDGKRLAFVRRVRTHTVLFVRDLASGAEHELYDGLDRDMQETWAIHGVYPTFAWMPGDSAIVFWAQGRIWRIDVASKAVSEIPFHVSATRQISEAVRFPQQIAPEKFDVKVLTNVAVSPVGNQVVYVALGLIFTRPLPDGKVTRLTKQSGDREGYPSFSRDGKWITYTTWNDHNLGTVRVVSAQGGDGRVVTKDPGHYVEPCFTPDGTRIVYRKTSGDSLASPLWTADPGIYVVPVGGGESKRVSRIGGSAQFGASSERVYFLDGDGQKTFLKAVNLDGSDPKTVVTSEDAQEIAVSPDEKWLAFKELWNAYVMPFPQSGQNLDIGPKSTSVPMRRLTRDTGENLQWSADSSKVYWSLGPELFERDLKEAFPFVPGGAEKPAEIPEKGRNISFTETFDKPSGMLALTGARIITMRGDEVIEKGTVLIDGNRIKEVGASVIVPAGTKVIDVSGRTIMPGIVDVHAHGPQDADGFIPQQNWADYAAVAFGVTTIHDPSHDTNSIFSASEMQKAGLMVGPRTFSTGTILYGAAGNFRAEINSLDDAKSHLRRLQAVGAFSVKSYNQPRREQRQQVIAAARELHMMVVPEGGSLFEHNMTMVADGHTGVEHAIPVAHLYDDVLQFWGGAHTGYTPTLGVGYGGLWGENYWYQHTNVWENERLLRYVPRNVIDPRSRRRLMAPEDDFNHVEIAKSVKALNDHGVSIQLGAHGQLQGMAPHWEIWMFAQGGMTPLECLRAATLNGARYLGLDHDIGSIEAGKLADLVVLERNPLENIRDTEHVRYTMVNGRLYEAETMNEVGTRTKAREKFFFEE